jgi:hypothetical protein
VSSGPVPAREAGRVTEPPIRAEPLATKRVAPKAATRTMWSLLATTSEGGTQWSPLLDDHPRREEVIAHEAVHRQQFALRQTAPPGTVAELEQEADVGARSLLRGRSFQPRLAAADDLVLAFSHHSAGKHLERFKAWLAKNTNFDVDAIDWDGQVLDLLASRRIAPLIDTAETGLQFARRERYRLEVEIYEQERVGGFPAPQQPNPAMVIPTTAQLEDQLFLHYIGTLGPSEFVPADVDEVPTAFLGHFLDRIEALTIVSSGFKIDDLAPAPRTAQIDAERNRLLDNWIHWEMKDLAFRFLLDDFARAVGGPNAHVSGLPLLFGGGAQRSLTAEDWLKSLDLAAYKARLVAAMTTEAVKRVGKDATHQGLLRSAADEQSRFATLQAMHRVITAVDTSRRDAVAHLRQLPESQWDTADNDLIDNPASALREYEAIAKATATFYSRLTRDRDNDVAMTEAAGALAAAVNAAPQTGQLLAGLVRLGTLLTSYRRQLDASRQAIEQRLAKEISVNYDEIAAGIKKMGEFASDYLDNTFVPKMNSIALARIRANVKVLEDRKANWATYSAATAKKLEDLATIISDLAGGLRNGSYDRIEFQGQVVTLKQVKLLDDQAALCSAEAVALRRPKASSKRYAKLVEALDGFNDVRDRIQSGKVKANRYGIDVFNAARKELGLDKFGEFTTYGDVVFGREVAAENPFLARLVIGWKVVEDLDDGLKGLVFFVGLGLLTIASLLTGTLAAAFLAPGASAAVGAVLFAIDATISIALGVHEKNEAQAFLDLVRLDLDQTVTGVSEEDAERALKFAWFGLVLAIALAAGGVAIMAAMRFLRGSSQGVELSVRYFRLAREDPQLFASLRKIITDPAKLDRLLGIAVDAKQLENLLHRMHGPVDLPLLERLMVGAGDAGAALRVLDVTTDAQAADAAMTKLVTRIPSNASRVTMLEAGGHDVINIIAILDRVPDLRNAHRLLAIVPDASRLAAITQMSSLTQLSDDALRTLGRLEPAALRTLQNANVKDVADIVRLVDQDPAAMNALFGSRGPAVVRGVQNAPYDTPAALAKALDRAAARLGPQPGYTSMVPPKLMSKGELVPAETGWVGTANKSGESFGTKVTSPSGKKLELTITWSPAKNELSLDTAFASPGIEAVPDGPRLVPAGPGAAAGGQPSGAPAAVYFTLQDMRLAKVPYGAPAGAGGVKIVRLHDIQNADTLAHLQWLRERYPNKALKDLVPETAIYKYGETIANQAGYRVVSVEFEGANATITPAELTDFYANGRRASVRGMTGDQVRAEHLQIYSRFGVAQNTPIEYGFDIVLTVQPW